MEIDKIQFEVEQLEAENRDRVRAIRAGKMRVVDGYRATKEAELKVRKIQQKLREMQKSII